MNFLFFIQKVFAADEDLANKLRQIDVSKEYFSHVLNTQVLIFSVIVAVIIGLSYLLNYRISGDKIKKEVEKKVDEERKKIAEREKDLILKIVESIVEQKKEVQGLRGEIYRTLAQFWDSEKSYPTAFIWWVRAAFHISKYGDEKMTRIFLNNARDSVNKTENAFQLDTDLVGEFQNLFADIDTRKYKIEKDLLSQAVKAKLEQQLK